MKIENFNTGIPSDPNLRPIYLNTKDNIKNKKHVRGLLKNITESSLTTLKKNLNNDAGCICLILKEYLYLLSFYICYTY